MAQKLDSNVESQIVDLYRNGLGCRVIAKQLNLAASSIHRVLKRNSIPRRDKRNRLSQRKYTDAQEREICTLYKNGTRSSALATQYNCSAGTIREIVRRNGFIVAGKGNRYREFSSDEIAEILIHYAAGHSQAEIALAIGTSQIPDQ